MGQPGAHCGLKYQGLRGNVNLQESEDLRESGDDDLEGRDNSQGELQFSLDFGLGRLASLRRLRSLSLGGLGQKLFPEVAPVDQSSLAISGGGRGKDASVHDPAPQTVEDCHWKQGGMCRNNSTLHENNMFVLFHANSISSPMLAKVDADSGMDTIGRSAISLIHN